MSVFVKVVYRETHVRKCLLLSYGSRGAVPPQLTAILHLKHAAVGVGAEHLLTEEMQHGYCHLTNCHSTRLGQLERRDGMGGRESTLHHG